jgi:hypothetical protein
VVEGERASGGAGGGGGVGASAAGSSSPPVALGRSVEPHQAGLWARLQAGLGRWGLVRADAIFPRVAIPAPSAPTN